MMRKFSRKKILIIFLLLCMFAFSPLIYIELTPKIDKSYYIEGVPIVEQGATHWCSSASLTMVLQYWGENVSLQSVGNSIDPEKDGAYGFELMNYAQARDFVAFSFDEHSVKYRESCIEELKIWVCHDYPVIVFQWTDVSKEGRHARVAIGYTESEVYMNDPWGFVYDANNEVFNELWSAYDEYGIVIIRNSTTSDLDNDGRTDAEEVNAGTDPFNYDNHFR